MLVKIPAIWYFGIMVTHRTDSSIILASKSPRRKALLEQAGIPFSVFPSDINESDLPCSEPKAYVRGLAEAKAAKVSTQFPGSWIIGADTVVVMNGNVLEKPETPEHARSMMAQLNGKTHQVLTGYCVCCHDVDEIRSDVAVTDVTFKRLTDAEIRWYTGTSEPYDKAGGYGIQELGVFLVKSINGSYTNVVGLPVCEVIALLTTVNALRRY